MIPVSERAGFGLRQDSLPRTCIIIARGFNTVAVARYFPSHRPFEFDELFGPIENFTPYASSTLNLIRALGVKIKKASFCHELARARVITQRLRSHIIRAIKKLLATERVREPPER